MLAKKYRSISALEIQNLFESGKHGKGSFLLVKYGPNNLEHSRFAVGVSKKLFSSYVERNQYSRKVYAAIKKLIDECPELESFANDYFVLLSRLPDENMVQGLSLDLQSLIIKKN